MANDEGVYREFLVFVHANAAEPKQCPFGQIGEGDASQAVEGTYGALASLPNGAVRHP